MYRYELARLDVRLLPDAHALMGTATRLADIQERLPGCTCVLSHYWRRDLIGAKIDAGLSDKYGQVLCPVCASPDGVGGEG